MTLQGLPGLQHFSRLTHSPLSTSPQLTHSLKLATAFEAPEVKMGVRWKLGWGGLRGANDMATGSGFSQTVIQPWHETLLFRPKATATAPPRSHHRGPLISSSCMLNH